MLEKGKKVVWSAGEDEILMALYPISDLSLAKDWDVLLKALPGRTASAIETRARRLKISLKKDGQSALKQSKRTNLFARMIEYSPLAIIVAFLKIHNIRDLIRYYFNLGQEIGEANPIITGETSDGYHTFNELYHHRTLLFALICNTYNFISWKSWQHGDGTMYPGMFIVGIDTPGGQATYHCDAEYWDKFDIPELIPCAPEFDGHTPEEALNRIYKLPKPTEVFRMQMIQLRQAKEMKKNASTKNPKKPVEKNKKQKSGATKKPPAKKSK